jgi:hypothetical protein
MNDDSQSRKPPEQPSVVRKFPVHTLVFERSEGIKGVVVGHLDNGRNVVCLEHGSKCTYGDDDESGIRLWSAADSLARFELFEFIQLFHDEPWYSMAVSRRHPRRWENTMAMRLCLTNENVSPLYHDIARRKGLLRSSAEGIDNPEDRIAAVNRAEKNASTDKTILDYMLAKVHAALEAEGSCKSIGKGKRKQKHRILWNSSETPQELPPQPLQNVAAYSLIPAAAVATAALAAIGVLSCPAVPPTTTTPPTAAVVAASTSSLPLDCPPIAATSQKRPPLPPPPASQRTKVTTAKSSKKRRKYKPSSPVARVFDGTVEQFHREAHLHNERIKKYKSEGYHYDCATGCWIEPAKMAIVDAVSSTPDVLPTTTTPPAAAVAASKSSLPLDCPHIAATFSKQPPPLPPAVAQRTKVTTAKSPEKRRMYKASPLYGVFYDSIEECHYQAYLYNERIEKKYKSEGYHYDYAAGCWIEPAKMSIVDAVSSAIPVATLSLPLSVASASVADARTKTTLTDSLPVKVESRHVAADAPHSNPNVLSFDSSSTQPKMYQ